jgi:hypothetical protein
MAPIPVVRWHAIFSRQNGGALRIWTQQSGEQLNNLSADQLAAYVSILKGDPTVLYNPDDDTVSSGPETP